MRGPTLSLKGRALRLLSQREHSRLELERKLAAHEEEPGQLPRILDELQAKGFISEERVVESVLNRRASRLGALRIRQELQAKGLDGERISEAVAQLRTTEVARAREVWRKRFGDMGSDDVKQLKALAQENARLKKLVAERDLEIEVMKEINAKKW